MTEMSDKLTSVGYEPRLPGIVATLSGELERDDIRAWSDALVDCIREHFPDRRFKLLLNAHGFEPASPEALKEFSAFIKENDLILNQCAIAAQVHHNEAKMEALQAASAENEGYFTEARAAYHWLRDQTLPPITDE